MYCGFASAWTNENVSIDCCSMQELVVKRISVMAHLKPRPPTQEVTYVNFRSSLRERTYLFGDAFDVNILTFPQFDNENIFTCTILGITISHMYATSGSYIWITCFQIRCCHRSYSLIITTNTKSHFHGTKLTKLRTLAILKAIYVPSVEVWKSDLQGITATDYLMSLN